MTVNKLSVKLPALLQQQVPQMHREDHLPEIANSCKHTQKNISANLA